MSPGRPAMSVPPSLIEGPDAVAAGPDATGPEFPGAPDGDATEHAPKAIATVARNMRGLDRSMCGSPPESTSHFSWGLCAPRAYARRGVDGSASYSRTV